MKKRKWFFTVSLMLSFILGACANESLPEKGDMKSAQSSAISSSVVMEVEKSVADHVSPSVVVETEAIKISSEEQVRALYREEYDVDRVQTTEHGWLVEYHQLIDENVRELDWVFPSGWRTYLGAYDKDCVYEITGIAEVTVYTFGTNIFNGDRVMPRKMVYYPREGDYSGVGEGKELYLPLEQKWEFGRGGRNQLYQVRVGLKGLECSFIAPVDNMNDMMNFYVASTYIPRIETSFEKMGKSRTFTIRIVDTDLSSGELGPKITEHPGWHQDGWSMMMQEHLYPCTVPEGELDTESDWIKYGTIVQEGKDVLIALELANEVLGYRLESGDLCDGLVPYFNLEFTRNQNLLFPEEYLAQ